MVTCEHVRREFRGPQGNVRGLDDFSLSVDRGEFVVVQGASGSGKSTLLLTLGGMLRPDSGTVTLDGTNLYTLDAAERSRLRARSIGFVFQLFHLIPYLTVRENVLTGLPGSVDTAARQASTHWLEQLGLTARADHRPSTLSAGERQRAALVRALIKNPAVILADEPTGNLDPANAAAVFRQLDAYRRQGGTVIVVTHGTDAAPFASRCLRLEQGRLQSDQSIPGSP